MGHVAALVTSHVNGLQPQFERKIEQTIETINPGSKTITAASMTTNYKLKRAARLPIIIVVKFTSIFPVVYFICNSKNKLWSISFIQTKDCSSIIPSLSLIILFSYFLLWQGRKLLEKQTDSRERWKSSAQLTVCNLSLGPEYINGLYIKINLTDGDRS